MVTPNITLIGSPNSLITAPTSERRCEGSFDSPSPKFIPLNKMLSFRNLTLLSYILRTHTPRIYETAYRCFSDQVENVIHTLRIRNQHASEVRSGNIHPKSGSACIDDILRIGKRCVLGDESLETVAEDGAGETEK